MQSKIKLLRIKILTRKMQMRPTSFHQLAFILRRNLMTKPGMTTQKLT
jgi:hypothetical protein